MKLAIFGGGQLGWLLMESFPEAEYFLICNSPMEKTKLLAKNWLKTNNFENQDILSFLSKCNVITYEYENLNLDFIKKNLKINIFPNINFLTISQNRINEKKIAKKFDLLVGDWYTIEDFLNLNKKKKLNLKNYILKTAVGGYDGKGQTKFNNDTELKNLDTKNYIIEKIIDFDYEFSIIATRDSKNNFFIFPIPLNFHQKQILIANFIFNNFLNLSVTYIEKIKKIAKNLNIIGTFTIECFYYNGKVFFNEFAPRVHNSGHWTTLGSNVSQFKNHMLAITNNKIIKPYIKKISLMVNLIGNTINKLNDFNFSNYTYKIYNYNKNKITPKRKMGHIVFTFENKEELKIESEKIINYFYKDWNIEKDLKKIIKFIK